MEFVKFIQNIFFNIPTSKEAFLANPYPVIVILFLIFLIFKGKIGFLFYFLFSLVIFLAGLFYGIINPVASNIVGIIIFAACSIVAIGLLLFKLLVKSS